MSRLEARDLSKSYSGRKVIEAVSLHVDSGEVATSMNRHRDFGRARSMRWSTARSSSTSGDASGCSSAAQSPPANQNSSSTAAACGKACVMPATIRVASTTPANYAGIAGKFPAQAMTGNRPGIPPGRNPESSKDISVFPYS